MPVDDPDVGVAFAIVCGAGAATAIGASVVFFPKLMELTNKKTLAFSLALAAGVMLYVSFSEIFPKSVLFFEEDGKDHKDAYLFATLCFFCGVLLILVLDRLVEIMLNLDAKRAGASDNTQKTVLTNASENIKNEDVARDPKCCNNGDYEAGSALEAENEGDSEDHQVAMPQHHAEIFEDKTKLLHMSLTTGLAISIHNFPEGLATFVATLHDPNVGAIFALAIAIHNIPEGFAVALPVYYATGNRCKAFEWAALSGMTEPIAALCGWLVLANVMGNEVYAIIFGTVAGMMVMISSQELLRTAHDYDREDEVTTYAFIGGMIIMAISLVLFVLCS